MGFFDMIVMAARAAQLLFSIIVLGTAGYVASLYSGQYFGTYYDFVPSQISFLIFCAVWSIIIVLWQVLTPRYAQRLAHRFVILGLDALTMLFWFAGWIALAAAIGAYEGPAPSSYKTMQATVAFAAFAWIAFLITTVLSAIDIFRGRGGAKHNPELQTAA